MKKEEMYLFVKRFNELEELEGFTFVKTIAKNYNNFKPEVAVLDKARNANKLYVEYIGKSNGLLKEYSNVDDKGKPISDALEDGRVSYSIKAETKSELEIKLKDLALEYKDAIDKHKAIEKEFIAELDKDVEVEVISIAEDDLPNDIKTEQVILLDELIKWNK